MVCEEPQGGSLWFSGEAAVTQTFRLVLCFQKRKAKREEGIDQAEKKPKKKKVPSSVIKTLSTALGGITADQTDSCGFGPD